MRWLVIVVSVALGCTEPVELYPERSPEGATISAMNRQTCALEQGEAWCWGSNEDFAIGLRDVLVIAPPTRIAGLPELGVIGVGQEFTCGLSPDREIWCWGRNVEGQLGSDDFVSRPEPAPALLPGAAARLSVGYGHACAVLEGGELYCWGTNREHQLGVPTLHDNQPRPVRVGAAQVWAEISAGDGHTCATTRSGELYCWGRNTQQQLGLGSGSAEQLLEPTRVGTATGWTEVAASQRFSCALRDPGELYCWGENADMQLGLGDNVVRTEPTRVGPRSDWRKLRVNAFHGCAFDGADQLWCWGRGLEGQLGLGGHEGRAEPTLIASDRFQDVAVGRFHTCARDRAGAVWCTGDHSRAGALGLPGVERVDEFTALPPLR